MVAQLVLIQPIGVRIPAPENEIITTYRRAGEVRPATRAGRPAFMAGRIPAPENLKILDNYALIDYTAL